MICLKLAVPLSWFVLNESYFTLGPGLTRPYNDSTQKAEADARPQCMIIHSASVPVSQLLFLKTCHYSQFIGWCVTRTSDPDTCKVIDIQRSISACFRLYFFIAAQIVQVTQLMLFLCSATWAA